MQLLSFTSLPRWVDDYDENDDYNGNDDYDEDDDEQANNFLLNRLMS